MELNYYMILVQILSATIDTEIDTVEAQITEAKNERTKNITTDYFNFLNGKIEGLHETKLSLNEVATAIKENYEMYMSQNIGEAHEE